MISYKIHLLRAGSADSGPERRYLGQQDDPLCESSRKSLQEMAKTFAYPPVGRVYTSPLSRCAETAGILYPGHQPLLVEGLKDMNLGTFEGKTFDELKQDDAFTRWLDNSFENAPPGGEKAIDFTHRIVAAFDGIVRQVMRDKITESAVITHGGVVMALMAAIALPKLPIHQWAAGNGHGYTLLTNTQLWLRDGCAEAFCILLHEE